LHRSYVALDRSRCLTRARQYTLFRFACQGLEHGYFDIHLSFLIPHSSSRSGDILSPRTDRRRHCRVRLVLLLHDSGHCCCCSELPNFISISCISALPSSLWFLPRLPWGCFTRVLSLYPLPRRPGRTAASSRDRLVGRRSVRHELCAAVRARTKQSARAQGDDSIALFPCASVSSMQAAVEFRSICGNQSTYDPSSESYGSFPESITSCLIQTAISAFIYDWAVFIPGSSRLRRHTGFCRYASACNTSRRRGKTR